MEFTPPPGEIGLSNVAQVSSTLWTGEMALYRITEIAPSLFQPRPQGILTSLSCPLSYADHEAE